MENTLGKLVRILEPRRSEVVVKIQPKELAMYAEFNESEDPQRDWELSVEFHPEEREEYDFYIEAARQKPVCTEVPQQEEPRKGRRKAARSRQKLHLNLL
jgi:hypothetical protein